MAIDRCPFLEYKGKMFGPSWYCKKAQKDVYDGEKLYKEYCAAGEKYYSQCPHFGPSSGSSGGCYLTSACTEAMGFADDCMELTTLRAFRDNWLAKQPMGKEEIAEYYHVAPAIVDAIHGLEDGKKVFLRIYHEMVLPCVQLIQEKKFSEAHDLYRIKTKELQEEYLRK